MSNVEPDTDLSARAESALEGVQDAHVAGNQPEKPLNALTAAEKSAATRKRNKELQAQADAKLIAQSENGPRRARHRSARAVAGDEEAPPPRTADAHPRLPRIKIRPLVDPAKADAPADASAKSKLKSKAMPASQPAPPVAQADAVKALPPGEPFVAADKPAPVVHHPKSVMPPELALHGEQAEAVDALRSGEQTLAADKPGVVVDHANVVTPPAPVPPVKKAEPAQQPVPPAPPVEVDAVPPAPPALPVEKAKPAQQPVPPAPPVDVATVPPAPPVEVAAVPPAPPAPPVEKAKPAQQPMPPVEHQPVPPIKPVPARPKATVEDVEDEGDPLSPPPKASSSGSTSKPGPLAAEDEAEFHKRVKEFETFIMDFSRTSGKTLGYLWDRACLSLSVARNKSIWNLFSHRWSLENDRDRDGGETVKEYLKRCQDEYHAKTDGMSKAEKEAFKEELQEWTEKYDSEVANDVVDKGEVYKVMRRACDQMEEFTRPLYTHYNIVVCGVIVSVDPTDAAAVASNVCFANEDHMRGILENRHQHVRLLGGHICNIFGFKKLSSLGKHDWSHQAYLNWKGLNQKLRRNGFREAFKFLQVVLLGDDAPLNVEWVNFEQAVFNKSMRIVNWPVDVDLPSVGRDKYKTSQMIKLVKSLYRMFRVLVQDGGAPAEAEGKAIDLTFDPAKVLRFEEITTDERKKQVDDRRKWLHTPIWTLSDGTVVLRVEDFEGPKRGKKIKKLRDAALKRQTSSDEDVSGESDDDSKDSDGEERRSDEDEEDKKPPRVKSYVEIADDNDSSTGHEEPPKKQEKTSRAPAKRSTAATSTRKAAAAAAEDSDEDGGRAKASTHRNKKRKAVDSDDDQPAPRKQGTKRKIVDSDDDQPVPRKQGTKRKPAKEADKQTKKTTGKKRKTPDINSDDDAGDSAPARKASRVGRAREEKAASVEKANARARNPVGGGEYVGKASARESSQDPSHAGQLGNTTFPTAPFASQVAGAQPYMQAGQLDSAAGGSNLHNDLGGDMDMAQFAYGPGQRGGVRPGHSGLAYGGLAGGSAGNMRNNAVFNNYGNMRGGGGGGGGMGPFSNNGGGGMGQFSNNSGSGGGGGGGMGHFPNAGNMPGPGLGPFRGGASNNMRNALSGPFYGGYGVGGDSGFQQGAMGIGSGWEGGQRDRLWQDSFPIASEGQQQGGSMIDGPGVEFSQDDM